METQTNHKTLNKTFKKELAKMFPSAKSSKKMTINYKPVYFIKDSNNDIIARVEKGNDLFKGLIIKTK